MKRTYATALVVITGGAVLATSLLAPGVSATAPDSVDSAKAASAKYHSTVQAERDGFSAVNQPCVSAPSGGMGTHYVNGARIGDPAVDALKPEVLLYSAGKNGKPVLTGVEYLKIDADGDLGTDDDRPTLFGQPFDGPMPGHDPGMPVHYDLHVWAWADNPSGIFAPFNPSLSCS